MIQTLNNIIIFIDSKYRLATFITCRNISLSRSICLSFARCCCFPRKNLVQSQCVIGKCVSNHVMADNNAFSERFGLGTFPLTYTHTRNRHQLRVQLKRDIIYPMIWICGVISLLLPHFYQSSREKKNIKQNNWKVCARQVKLIYVVLLWWKQQNILSCMKFHRRRYLLAKKKITK